MVTKPLYTQRRSAMGTPLPISVLDFLPMRDGETASDSFHRTVELARQAELRSSDRLRRYGLASRRWCETRRPTN